MYKMTCDSKINLLKCGLDITEILLKVVLNTITSPINSDYQHVDILQTHQLSS